MVKMRDSSAKRKTIILFKSQSSFELRSTFPIEYIAGFPRRFYLHQRSQTNLIKAEKVFFVEFVYIIATGYYKRFAIFRFLSVTFGKYISGFA